MQDVYDLDFIAVDYEEAVPLLGENTDAPFDDDGPEPEVPSDGLPGIATEPKVPSEDVPGDASEPEVPSEDLPDDASETEVPSDDFPGATDDHPGDELEPEIPTDNDSNHQTPFITGAILGLPAPRREVIVVLSSDEKNNGGQN